MLAVGKFIHSKKGHVFAKCEPILARNKKINVQKKIHSIPEKLPTGVNFEWCVK